MIEIRVGFNPQLEADSEAHRRHHISPQSLYSERIYMFFLKPKWTDLSIPVASTANWVWGEYRGSLTTAKATKEIILSAGSVGTPSILMHSGIGDREALAALGIPSLLDLESVGTNATDQPLFRISWSVDSTQTIDSIAQNITRYNEAFAQWNRTHTRPFVELGATHVSWLRLDEDSLVFSNVTNPSGGQNTAHIEIGMGSMSEVFRKIGSSTEGYFQQDVSGLET
ncbi:hypothetical protein DFH09DRAFT_1085142 [Mycena vulgaris]|nr:hypothetical protein DFH09DRAFT_1085142 [Mycena vulgaris]